MKINWTFLLVLLVFWSCRNSLDLKDPKEVGKDFLRLIADNQMDDAYKLLQDSLRNEISLSDFSDQYKRVDSLRINNEILMDSEVTMNHNTEYPNLRQIVIPYKIISKESGDTLRRRYSVTICRRNEIWQVMWYDIKLEAAERKNQLNKVEEAINIYSEILKSDPFNEKSTLALGWIYYRQNEYDKSEEYARKTLEINSDSDEAFNLLANIYNSKNEYDLAIENYNKALELISNENENVYILSNLASLYIEINKLLEAQNVLEKALSTDSTDTHLWWIYGRLFVAKNNTDSAIYSFKKATNLDKMSDYIQMQIYFDYSKSLFDKSKEEGVNQKQLIEESKKYIVKAMDLDPENEDYKIMLMQLQLN